MAVYFNGPAELERKIAEGIARIVPSSEPFLGERIKRRRGQCREAYMREKTIERRKLIAEQMQKEKAARKRK